MGCGPVLTVVAAHHPDPWELLRRQGARGALGFATNRRLLSRDSLRRLDAGGKSGRRLSALSPPRRAVYCGWGLWVAGPS